MEPFGARLKREREQRKITLDDIALSTKIGARFLAALEEEQFDRLPGGIFNKSFVRAYARYLGIDEAQAVADYVAASTETLPESQPEETIDLAAMAAQSKKTDRGGGIPWGAFALALLIVAFSFAVWGFYSREKTARPTRTVIPAPLAKASAPGPANVVPDASSQPAPPQTVSASSQPAPGLSGAAPGLAASEPAASESAAPEPAEPEPAATVPAATAAATPSPSGSTPGSFLVQIKAREDSWVSIVADGKPVMQEILSASAEKSIEARSQVILKTGNVGALDILFNGKQLPPQGGFSQVKTLSFDSNGLRTETTRPQ